MHDNSSKSKIGKNEYCGKNWCIVIHQNPKLADINHIHYTPRFFWRYCNFGQLKIITYQFNVWWEPRSADLTPPSMGSNN